MKTIGLVLVVLLVSLASQSAHGESVLVAVDEEMLLSRGIAADAAERQLTARGWTLPALGKVRQTYADAVITCGAKAQCIAGVASQTKADVVLILHMTHSYDSDGKEQTKIVAKLFGKDGKQRKWGQRFCSDCRKNQRLAASIQEVIDELLADEAGHGDNTFLEIRTVPSDASVTIDGDRAVYEQKRVSGGKYGVSPGEHSIVVTAEGYMQTTRRVHVKAGETQQLEIELSKDREYRAEGAPRFTVWKWAALGSGVAVGALGVRWLFVDESGSQNGARTFEHKETTAAGVVATAAGAALVSTGVLLWYLDHRRAERSENQVYVTGAPGQGGGMMVFGGSF